MAESQPITAPRPRLIYLHGFRSSPSSFKARMLAQRLESLGRLDDYRCPPLPPSPAAAIRQVEQTISPTRDDVLVGSSLGGFYATWLGQRYGCRTVLLNPAVNPARDLRGHIGEQQAWHSDERFFFDPRYIGELEALETGPVADPTRWLLVAAKGDELLDWREMVGRYPAARLILLEGGDHGLSGFADLIDEVLAFAGFLSDRRAG
jgi:uncharacterized protein